MATTIYPSSITWNGSTWNSADGGPMSCTFSQTGQVVKAWTGDAIWPQFCGVIHAGCRVSVQLQDVKSLIATPNTMADLVLTVSDGKPTPTTATGTVANCVYIGSTHTQPQGLGDMTIDFVVQSADGSTNPIAAGA